MKKRLFVKSDYIKLEILKALREQNNLTFYMLTKITKINWNSLNPNCNFLEKLGFIKIKQEKTPGMEYSVISITKEGEKILNLFE